MLVSLCTAKTFNDRLPTRISVALQPIFSKKQENIKPFCVIQHCGGLLKNCVFDVACRQTLNCFKDCTASDVECNNNCFFTYSNPIFNDFTNCLITNKCLPGLQLSSESCPYNGNIENPRNGWANSILLGPKNLGKVYIARGWNPTYDCVPCQKATYTGIYNPNDPNVQLFTEWTSESEDGSVRSTNYTLVQTGTNTMLTKYSLFGMDVEEHYYMLDWTEDGKWVMFYYCGYGFGSQYQGALIVTTEKEFDVIPRNIESSFDEAIIYAGLIGNLGPVATWCKPEYNAKCKEF